MENKLMITGIGIMILLVSVMAFSLGNTNNNTNKINAAATSFGNNDDSPYNSILTGTTDEGSVAIELKPHKPTDSEFSVDISVNTHSVGLNNYDLTEITTLEYEGGKVNPISAPSLNGHHASGILVFPITTTPEQFTIKIVGIPSVQERAFEWGK